MTDRELLELAAKAAGMNADWINEDDADYLAEREGLWLKGERSPDNSKYWNPLTDDGDALRLAVKLGLSIQSGTYKVAVEFIPQESDDGTICVREGYDADPYAATRRAIVRAAAEIGRNMK